MLMIAPNTDLILLKSPIELDQNNQLTFSNATAQYNYFNGLPKLVEDNFTYQRKDGKIRFPANADDLQTYNYCMYRNTSYSDKWFYAFITNVEYLNDNTSLISIKTDVWQTWQFQLNWKQSYVNREHVNDDSIGAHTLDEGLPTGEPINNASLRWSIASNQNDEQRVVLQVTQLPEKSDGNPIDVPAGTNSRVYNGIGQGCYFVVCNSYDNMAKLTRWYDAAGQKDSVVAAFLVPYLMVQNAIYNNYNIKSKEYTASVRIGFLPASYTPHYFNVPAIYYSSTLDGYTPKNNKLYCYPYSYLTVSNSAGSDIVLKYEDFENPTHPAFECRGTIGQGCNIRLYPNTYKRTGTESAAYDYGINCSKLPILSWQSDYYLNWQAQNGANYATQSQARIVNSSIGILSALNSYGNTKPSNSGSLTSQALNVGSSITSAISTVSDVMQEKHEAELVPAQAMGNTNCADLTYAMGRCGFVFQRMSCRSEYAKVLDNFFSMFGYKINRMKIPNITGRQNWNYVKTVGCNIIANIPQQDLQEIKDMFDNGVTLWHNAATFQDYSQSNNIV